MKILLLDSVRSFREGNSAKAADLANTHFNNLHGANLFKTRVVTESKYLPYWEWDHFLVFCVTKHWSGQIPLGTFFGELWRHYPAILLPFMIGKLDFMDFTSYLSWEEEEAFEELKLIDLCSLLENNCREGKILNDEDPKFQSIFPMIGNDYFEMLRNEQPSNYFAKRLKEAITRGFEQRAGNCFSILANKQPDYIAKRLFILLFLGLNAPNRRLSELVHGLSNQSSIQLELFSSSLHNHMDSIPDDDELADFIFLYTGGQVLPEDPRAWMRLFIQSVETGKMLIPEV
jgi:hypothetical protein